jgi:hypothetical protein
MRLEDYWGVGPKTAARLRESMGEPAAVEAIERSDVGALVGADVDRGRATRILRRANGAEGMATLATGDARAVYKQLVSLAAEYAVTTDAGDRIRVLTPFRSVDAAERRLDRVVDAAETWERLDEPTRAAVLDAFESHESGGERAAVETALALREAGATEGVFAPLADLDGAALRDASAALDGIDGETVEAGVDDELDDLRATLAAVEQSETNALDVLETVRESGARDTAEFREALVEHLRAEADVPPSRVREAAPGGATDAADFVDETLRSLRATVEADAADREAAVAADLEERVAEAREDVDAAVEAVDDIALYVSLARFAAAFDLTKPTFVADGVGVEGARNLSIVDDEDVQPVDYAVGHHGLGPPSGERVAVLTGANSGGKTTLLETVCQVAVLASMGLPVPAERAEVALFDSVVFHRRHASFNAGVLESTLRSVVPPLAGGGHTLMLVDEFEAITEPGSAADLLHGLVTLTVERDALGAFVTHLADDLEPLPEAARTDGIFAEGLDTDLELRVDYQPRFETVGRSTPEFIVSRLVADAADEQERVGFETLASAVGEAAVQRTLADARWSGS